MSEKDKAQNNQEEHPKKNTNRIVGSYFFNRIKGRAKKHLDQKVESNTFQKNIPFWLAG